MDAEGYLKNVPLWVMKDMGTLTGANNPGKKFSFEDTSGPGMMSNLV